MTKEQLKSYIEGIADVHSNNETIQDILALISAKVDELELTIVAPTIDYPSIPFKFPKIDLPIITMYGCPPAQYTVPNEFKSDLEKWMIDKNILTNKIGD